MSFQEKLEEALKSVAEDAPEFNICVVSAEQLDNLIYTNKLAMTIIGKLAFTVCQILDKVELTIDDGDE